MGEGTGEGVKKAKSSYVRGQPTTSIWGGMRRMAVTGSKKGGLRSGRGSKKGEARRRWGLRQKKKLKGMNEIAVVWRCPDGEGKGRGKRPEGGEKKGMDLSHRHVNYKERATGKVKGKGT